MAPAPEDALRALLADSSRATAEAFVADLWRARGYDVGGEGDPLLADGRELVVVEDAGDTAPPADGWLVATTPPPDDRDDVVGPADIYRMLLYDVERERAADLFESHFDRPLDDDFSDLRGWSERLASASAPDGEPDGDAADVVRAAGEDGPTKDGAGADAAATALARALRRVLPTADLRALATDRRLQALVLVVLLVVGATGWALVGYEPPAEATDPPFALDQPTPVDGTYRAVVEVRLNESGETMYFEQTRTYAPGDPPVALGRWTFGDADDRVTVVDYHRGRTQYVRQTWTNASKFRQFNLAVPGQTTAVISFTSTRTTYAVQRDVPFVQEATLPSIAASLLARLPYERAGTTTYEGRDVVRYVPATGWVVWRQGTDEETPHHVRSATGEVLVDPDSGAILLADVEATAVQADTWGAALTNDTTGLSVEYRYEPGVGRPRAPPWVEALDGNDTVRNATG